MIQKILSWVSLIACEAIMIAAFLIYGKELPTEIMILDMAVCTIIIGLFFVDIICSWSDRFSARLGAMGIRWVVTFIFTISSISVMILLRQSEFSLQLLVQGGLIVLLTLGFIAVIFTKARITEVSSEEGRIVKDRDRVKQAWRDLLENIELQADLPIAIRERTDKILQDMRYLSPTNNTEAMNIDRQLIEGANEISHMLYNYQLNSEQLEKKLAQCERLLQRRRSQYSN